ncbi:hypothetical protein LOD99_1724 [Oopsacas minuta]|uniref:Basic leucine zipper domain-containing protein n=1 Tax=Oopsacas minuta TaxID=111878 RepID=A0AAV7K5S8_9METZ|nr:hypothetical protein LOD99_1724 [Oopsacas minuta]
MAQDIDRELWRLGFSLDDILQLDIPSLNKEINRKSLSHEEGKQIKEFRKKYKKREYARRRHRETVQVIEQLEQEKVYLRKNLEEMEYQVRVLKHQRKLLQDVGYYK